MRPVGQDFLLALKSRGLSGVLLAISDDHPGLKKAIAEVLPAAAWQRCYGPRKADDDCLTELRWLYDRRDLEEARRDLAAWLARWQERYPKLCAWAEANIEETFTFYRLPREHHKHLKSRPNYAADLRKLALVPVGRALPTSALGLVAAERSCWPVPGA